MQCSINYGLLSVIVACLFGLFDLSGTKCPDAFCLGGRCSVGLTRLARCVPSQEVQRSLYTHIHVSVCIHTDNIDHVSDGSIDT